LGFFKFGEVEWTPKLKSSLGYSMLTIKNANLQSPDAFRKGQYALINLRCYPVENVMLGLNTSMEDETILATAFIQLAIRFNVHFKFNFSHKVEMK
jgi:hypothetical protein